MSSPLKAIDSRHPNVPRGLRAGRWLYGWRLLACWLMAASMMGRGEAFALAFTSVTESAGLSAPQYVNVSRPTLQPFMSGGAAAGDYDQDGWVDVYITRLDGPNALYRNLGNGRFEDVSPSAFAPIDRDALNSNGAAWGDIDNDGDLDLYVTSLFSHRYQMFANQGDGTFREEGGVRGASLEGPDLHFGFSPSFGDYDRDGFLDLYTTEWRMVTQNRARAPYNSRLFRNRGQAGPGTFEDVTYAVGVAMERVTSAQELADAQSFTGRFADMDGDGWPELLVASDHGTSRLFWNDTNGHFTDGTQAAGVGTDRFGMGSAIGDYDQDGDLDWFVSSIYAAQDASRDGNRLFHNEGNRTFSDRTSSAGVRDGGWGWGASFFDFDNDGDLDVAQASGQQLPFPSVNVRGFEQGQVHLWRNEGQDATGTPQFVEISAELGLRDAGNGKGLLHFDYDRDGDEDLLVINNGVGPTLWRNEVGQDFGWLNVELLGTVSNRQGIGAWVTLDPDRSQSGDEQLVEISGSSNFLGQNPAYAHFGLGQRQQIDALHIRWPSGLVQTLSDVEANQWLTLVEPVPEPACCSVALLATYLLLIRATRCCRWPERSCG